MVFGEQDSMHDYSKILYQSVKQIRVVVYPILERHWEDWVVVANAIYSYLPNNS